MWVTGCASELGRQPPCTACCCPHALTALLYMPSLLESVACCDRRPTACGLPLPWCAHRMRCCCPAAGDFWPYSSQGCSTCQGRLQGAHAVCSSGCLVGSSMHMLPCCIALALRSCCLAALLSARLPLLLCSRCRRPAQLGGQDKAGPGARLRSGCSQQPQPQQGRPLLRHGSRWASGGGGCFRRECEVLT